MSAGSGASSPESERPEVLVVGSINLDLSLLVERFPEPGETLIGRDVVRGGGGKGANQAVAAARLGRRVAMAGAVGDDDAGPMLLRLLAADGIDTSGVGVVEDCASGLAVIEVDSAGENRIVVIPGANHRLADGDLERLAETVATVPVVLAQLEIPVDVVVALAGLHRAGRLILNPAPAVEGLSLEGFDIVVPNRGELAAMAGGEAAASIDEVADQARRIGADMEAVVVTLGGDGALVVGGMRTGSVTVDLIPAVPVDAVDTTAAGDAFCGGLADALCLGADVIDAARWAVRVAAVTVTRRGAQDSLPMRSDVVV